MGNREAKKSMTIGELRGIYFIDPEDGEHKRNRQKREEKFQWLQGAKKHIMPHEETRAKSCESDKIPKDKACMHRGGS